MKVDGENYRVPSGKLLELIKRLVEERDRARTELREGRVRTLHWRGGPKRNEKLEDFDAAE